MHHHPEPFRQKAIPFAMHGDGVTVTAVGKKSQKHMDCVSFLIALIIHVLEAKQKTTSSVIWQVITWSFYWLYQGLWPDRDWTGRMFDENDGLDFARIVS